MPRYPDMLPCVAPLLLALAAFAQDASAAESARIRLAQRAPLAPALGASVPGLETSRGPTRESADVDAAIDSSLQRFAAANPANPAAITALKAAAVDVRQHPEAYTSPDGSPNQAALGSLISGHFGAAGTVAVPSPATGDVHVVDGIADLGSLDIEALVNLVLMEASRSARDDLRASMQRMEAIEATKQRGRRATVAVHARTPAPITGADPAAVSGDRLDSLGDANETELLRLQMAMDRLTKLMSTLSNLLKKSSDTASDITGNIK